MKLSKIEAQALASYIVTAIKKTKLPAVIAEWEIENQKIEDTEIYKSYKEWYDKYNESFKSSRYTFSTPMTLKAMLGLPPKPVISGMSGPTTQEVEQRVIIKHITNNNSDLIIEELVTEYTTN